MHGDLWKFGSGMEGDPHEYAPVYMREDATGVERLVFTPSGRQISLMLDLAAEMGEPLGVMYVLRLPRARGRAGRYYSLLMEHDGVRAFLKRFEVFLEGDARHDVWVVRPDTNAMVVYDNHNWMYAYGPLDSMEGVLARHGLRWGTPEMPVPHSHYYHAEFDDAQDQVLAWTEWAWKPLCEDEES